MDLTSLYSFARANTSRASARRFDQRGALAVMKREMLC